MDDTTQAARAITLRLDPDIRQGVDLYARHTRRTVNGAVNYLLSLGLDQQAGDEQGAPAYRPDPTQTR